jgi:UDP-N-acetylglucosamine 3-dehydrogenase
MSERIDGVLVGCGRMGQRHLKYLNQSTRVGSFCIVDPAVLQVEGRHKAIFATIDEALALKPKWAVVAVSTPYHLDVGLALMKAGVATLMEKPLAPTVEQCRKLLDASEATKTPLFVGHVERFNPAVKALRDFLKSGAAGKIEAVHVARYGAAPAEVLAGNNVVVDLTVHDIDILFSLGLSPKLSSALNLKATAGHIDHTDSLFAVGKNEAMASLSTSWRSPVRKRVIRALCSKGIAEVDLMAQTLKWEGEPAALPEVKPVETLGAQLDAFLDALEGKSSPLCIAQDGAGVVELAESIVSRG